MDRLAIRTFVSEFDPISIREALLREHYRGGQSFYVVPRIKDLPEVEDFLKEQLPELSYVVAHGQMAAGELDDRMNAFYDGKYDILLGHNDCRKWFGHPNRQHNGGAPRRYVWFGAALSNSGRVGRSKVRAYAYLTTKPRMKLTQTAEKRLRVLGRLIRLGRALPLPVRIWTFAVQATCLEKSNQATCAMSDTSFINPCWKRRLPKSNRANWKDCRQQMINGPHRSIWASLS